MNWSVFPYFALCSVLLFCIGTVFIYVNKKIVGNILYSLGIVIAATFVVGLWINLERPPLRTLGETRLWYSCFMGIIGWMIYLRWQYKWILLYSTAMAALFFSINYMNPDTYNKTLMPALQSPWFVPHVVVYIFSYAILGVSSFLAIKGLYLFYKKQDTSSLLHTTDQVVKLGFGFLTLGLLFGALWAKEAWGSYWTWDPKETWAFLTWIGYLIYIHYRFQHPLKHKNAFMTLAMAFVVLLACWFGVNYMPSAQMSVHTYSQS